MSEVGKMIKLAVFRNMERSSMNGFEHVGRCDVYDSPGAGAYMRISETVDVTFEPLKNDEVVRNALRALDGAELKAREELQRALDDIANQRAQLMALTHQS